MRRLVESWIQAENALHGNNLAAAVRHMNERRAMSVTASRVSEWRRGVYVPSQLVLSHMLFRTLPWALSKAGIANDPQEYQALEELIWNSSEEGEKILFELL